MAVFSGLDVLVRDRLDLLRGRRVGVLCHPASISSNLIHIVDLLVAAGVRPARLFGPEHGVRGEAQDMIGVDSEKDSRTGIPVVSLYGESVESLTPPRASLVDLDVLVVDLQDVGSRYYTYIWTMALAMQAAAAAGIQVIVCDRPNPIGGTAVEGGEVDPAFESFVGLGSLPNRHGLTIGEVARLVRRGMPWGGDRFKQPLEVDLVVVSTSGWRRSDGAAETRLPWVLPSPNMPTPETALVYPGLCLIEGTNVSEGRGTTRPFEIIGAPFVDGYRLAQGMSAYDLPGVRFRPLTFRPTFHKFAGKPCGGIALHVSDPNMFRPYRTGVAILRELWAQYPGQFQWRTEPYEFVADRLAIDLLTGGEAVRLGIERGEPLEEIAATWLPAERAFLERRAEILLYGSA